MHSLATVNELAVLNELKNKISNSTLTPNQAWSCFSQPEEKKEFGKKKIPATFSKGEVEALKSLKIKVLKKLETQSRRSCSYCKRAVGKHGYGWHVEHVKCKSKNHKLTFDLSNLVLACVDCNMIKNHAVDRKSTPYDIIDPSEENFDYSSHLNYSLVATEDFCYLKYRINSPEGTRTYTKLKFDTLERMEILKSLSPEEKNRLRLLDDRASSLAEISPGHPLGIFCAELKRQIVK